MNIPQYITQLTKEWIKSVSKKLVQGSYIRVDESEDARTVSVDVDGLRDCLGSGTVSSVDGHNPDENGAVSFGLIGSKWVKTDSSGHLTTNDETPVSLDRSSTGVLYAHSGTLYYDGNFYDESGDPLYVDTTSDQTVGGNKTFSSGITVSGTIAIKSSVNNSYVLLCGSNEYTTGGHIVLGSNLGTTNGGGIVSLRTNKENYSATLTITPGSGRNLLYYENNSGTTYNRFKISENFEFFSRNNAATTGRWMVVGFKTHDNVTTGQFVSGVDSNGNHDAYLRAVKNSVNSSIRVVSTGTAGTCSQTLENPPSADSDATDDKQIAWRGWVNNKFCKKNGTVTIADAQTITGAKTFSGIVTANGSFTANGSVFVEGNILGTTGRTSSLLICSGQTWEHGAHVVLSKAGGFSLVSEKMSGGVMTSAYYLSGSNEGKLTWGGTTTDSTSTEDNQLPKLGYINDKFVRKSFSEAATEDKVLMLQEGSQTASWVASQLTPSEAPTSTKLGADTRSSTTAQNDTWTYASNSTNGVEIWVTSRVIWNGTKLIEYRRKMIFGYNGMLYYVGAETEHQIETPTEIRWS